MSPQQPTPTEPRVLPCFACGRELESAIAAAHRSADAVLDQPYDANTFSSSGHYGATYFDEMSGYLALNICTGCLKAHEDRMAWMSTRTTHTQVEVGKVGEW